MITKFTDTYLSSGLDELIRNGIPNMPKEVIMVSSVPNMNTVTFTTRCWDPKITIIIEELKHLNLYKETIKLYDLSRQMVFHDKDNKHDLVKTMPGELLDLIVFEKTDSFSCFNP